MKLLVSHGADANIHGGSDSWSPLFYASMAGIHFGFLCDYIIWSAYSI